MAARASIAGHPIHPMLVTIPIGLFVFSLVADVIARWAGSPWSAVALYCMGGGIVGALLAAPFGLVDLLSMKDPRVKRIGLAHMGIMLGVVALFAVSFALRWASESDLADSSSLALSLLGVLLMAAGGWLGGQMVFVHGVGVREGARQPVIERRHARKPWPAIEERRRGAPLGQH